MEVDGRGGRKGRAPRGGRGTEVLVHVEELFRLLRLKRGHHVDEGVDKERPQHTSEFRLSRVCKHYSSAGLSTKGIPCTDPSYLQPRPSADL